MAFTSREDAIWTKEQLLEPPPPLGHRPRRPGGALMPLDNVVFWVFAPISVASAIGMLLMRNAVHAALFLIVNFFCLAVLYLLLDAAVPVRGPDRRVRGRDHGAVPVRDHAARRRPRRSGPRAAVVAAGLAFVLAAGFVVELFVALRAGIGFATKAPDGFDAVNAGGNTQAVAKVLFARLLLPVRGDVGPADRRGDRGDGARAAQGARRHPGRDRRRAAGPATPSTAREWRREDADRVLPAAVGDPVRARHRRRPDPHGTRC